MKLNILPYQLGMWLAQYGSRYCHVCKVSYSSVVSEFDVVSESRNSLGSVLNYLDKGILCQGCYNDINWMPQPFDVILSDNTRLPIQPMASYDSIIRKAIIAFKYQADFSALPLLVSVIKQIPVPYGCTTQNSVIIPVSTTDKRLVKRGFDPVFILSKYLSQQWQIEIFSGVKRTDDTVSQQGLTREERLKNVIGSFELVRPMNVTNIILFDDVATTGSTLKSLAECVNNTNHPSTISAYALAHGNS